jgi:hypothetical protein
MIYPIEYISHSRLEMFRKNPMLYKKTYIDKVTERTSSPAMMLGSLVHSMLLEPSTVEEKFAVAPMVDKRTKAGKEAFEEFQKTLKPETLIITHDDVAQANRMIAAIQENSASSYFLNCPTIVKEQEILTEVVFDAEPIKVKFICDAYCPENNWVLDLKTTASYDVCDWGKDCVFNGYFRQLALYRFCLRSMQIPIRDCYHIVCDKGEYPTSMVVQFDNADIDRSENQVFETIRKFIESHRTGIFQPVHYGIVPKVTAPAWSWR